MRVSAVRSTEQKVETLRDITNRLEQNLRGATAHDALLRRINNHADLIPTFNNTVAGHGFAVVQRGLIELLILALTRCYDPASRNRASLPHALVLLADDAVIDQLALDARGWLPDGMLADVNEQTVRKEVVLVRERYGRLEHDCALRRSLIALRHYRDDYLAHSLVQMTERERLIFGDLEDVLTATLPVVAGLTLSVHGLSWSPDDAKRAWDGYADEFWLRTLPR
jgi:hypothetical protein